MGASVQRIPTTLRRATWLITAALLCAGAAEAAKVTFRYQPVIGGVSSVSAAGNFNGWNATANPLKDDDKDGVWETIVEIPAGKLEYKFVVNGDQWLTDESAADFSSDGFGGRNSVATVAATPIILGHGSAIKKAPAAKVGLHKVTFSYPVTPKPQSVHIAGTFNDWTVGRSAMSDSDGDGTWTTTLLLPTGSYQYKFVVNSSQWFADPAHQDADTDDGHGGKNSIVNVDDRFPMVSVKRGDGDIFPDGIVHEQAASEVNHFGAGRVEFTARSHRDDIDGIDIVTWIAGAERVVPMRVANQDRVYDYWRAAATLPTTGDVPYAFRYHDGQLVRWLTSKGLTATGTEGRFTFTAQRFPAFETPDWVKHAVIYQIFPDRFRNGNKANDQDFKEWYYEGRTTKPADGQKLNVDAGKEYYHLVSDWNDYQVLTKSPWGKDGRDWMAFYGGDLAGVRQSLDYLKDLGVTAIYFNPVFEAKSTHKYDAADYRKIDPHFGTNEEFITLVSEARAKGIRVIVDIVYNHSGNTTAQFKEAVEKGTASPTYNWYEFKKWPLPAGWPNTATPFKPADYYYCWWGYGDLPDLNFDLSRNNDAEKSVRDVKDAQVNVALVNYLLDATEYWLKDAGVDGLRLDVPNEVPYWFWKLFNERVKKVKPDAYIVGELWGNASDYVRPGMYDAVMNYAFFKDPVQRFLGMGQGSAAEFDAALATGRLTYPTQAVEVQMNLIDSHDTPRFLTQVGGNVKRQMLAALFGMTYVGAPHIYYGDEIAMEGAGDPDCRRPFVWDWEKEPRRVAMHDWYRKLAAVRHAHPALRTGDFRTLHAQDMQYAYARSGGGEDFVVAINAGKSDAEVPLDLAAWGGAVTATDLLSGAKESWGALAKVKLAGETGRVFQIRRADGAKASGAVPAKKKPAVTAKPRAKVATKK